MTSIVLCCAVIGLLTMVAVGTFGSIVGPTCSRATLPFVHGCHSGDRNLPAVLDEFGRQALWCRHHLGPRVTPGKGADRGVHREIGRVDSVKVGPVQRK